MLPASPLPHPLHCPQPQESSMRDTIWPNAGTDSVEKGLESQDPQNEENVEGEDHILDLHSRSISTPRLPLLLLLQIWAEEDGHGVGCVPTHIERVRTASHGTHTHTHTGTMDPHTDTQPRISAGSGHRVADTQREREKEPKKEEGRKETR